MSFLPNLFGKGQSKYAADLISAAKIGSVAEISALLDRGVDVNASDKDGVTALMVASFNGHSEAVNLLLSKRADVNAKTSDYGQTALRLASQHGHIEIVKLLLAAHADINATDKDGKTALYWAVTTNEIDVVRELIASGADINIKDKSGETPLMVLSCDYWWRGEELIRLLIAVHADIDAKNNEGLTALLKIAKSAFTFPNIEAVNQLISAGANVNAKDNAGTTVLMAAANNNRADMVKLLLAAGADVNCKDNNGRTALILACMKISVEEHESLHRQGYALDMQHIDLEVIKDLLDARSDVNVKDKYGKTAFSYARGNSHNKVVELLTKNSEELPL